MHKTLGGGRHSEGFLSHGPVKGGEPLVSKDRVAVWWLSLEDIHKDDLAKLEALLIDEELARANLFHFERDRQIYVAAHGICRGLLSYCLGQGAQSWRFSIEDHGKPELICRPDGPKVRVNISHTRGLAAVALTLENDIGVDVEWRQRNARVEDLAKRMFAESERQLVQNASDNEKQNVFLTFWTLKEAYVKAIGKGLSQPLDAFAFTLEDLKISFRDPLAGEPTQWHFERYHPGPDHLMSLAVNHPNAASLTVDAGPAPKDFLLDLARA
ncbi:MAG: 4'-phosphopantetheinyl transferase superfamily protein [Roseibium sp.]